MDAYRCFYCSYGFTAFEDVIKHCVSAHFDDKLFLKKAILCPRSGHFRYVAKEYNYIPSHVNQEGFSIKPSQEGEKIILLPIEDMEEPRTKEGESSEYLEEDIVLTVGSHERDECLQELIKLLPSVVSELEKEGLLETYMKFNKLISEGKFPLDNIAFLLFMDVVKFFSCGSIKQMRYNKSVKSFWLTGYRLFHSKFLRFMGGPKGQGLEKTDIEVCGSAHDPSQARVNFIVPRVQILETSIKLLLKDDIKPGILNNVLDLVQDKYTGSRQKPMKICFDAKRISGCLTEGSGDVDLFGCEDSPTLEEIQKKNKLDLEKIEDVLERAQDQIDMSSSVFDITTASGLLHDMKDIIQIISLRVRELREVTVSKELAVTKFKTLGQPDWRNSKYKFVISSLQTSLYQIKECVSNSLKSIDQLGKACAEIQQVPHLYCTSSQVDLNNQENYICIKGNGTSSQVVTDDASDIDRHILQQRGDEWHKLRKLGKVTGSTAYRALGLESLKEQIFHYDTVFNNIPSKVRDAKTQKLLDYGTEHELDAVATICGKILPVYFPKLCFTEEGSYDIKHNKNSFCIVSPDGSGRYDISGPPLMGFEIKCPHPDKKFSTQQLYKIPIYYSTQLLCEMKALQCSQLLFICYTDESTTVFEVSSSEDAWNKIWKELLVLYGQEDPQRPRKRSENVAKLRDSLKEYLERHVTFLCEFPSVKVQPCVHQTSPDLPTLSLHISPTSGRNRTGRSDIAQILYGSLTCVRDASHLTRKMATEVFVFLMSDLDRVHDSSIPHALPIAYGLQGNSLPCRIARRMYNTVLKACQERGIDVRVFSCDGQFIGLVHTDVNQKALTQIQLQKQYWAKVSKLPKTALLRYIEDINVNPEAKTNATQGGTTGIDSSEKSVVSLSYQGCNVKPFQMKTRHMRALKLVKKASKSTSSEATEGATEKALSILPSNLKDKVDSDTFNDIVSALKTFVSEESKSKDEEFESDDDGENVAETVADDILPGEEVHQKIKLKRSDVTCILSALKNAPECKRKQKWSSMDYDTFCTIMSSAKATQDICYLGELKTIIKVLKQLYGDEMKGVLISSPKSVLVNACSSILGDGTHVIPRKQSSRSSTCQSLRELCMRNIRKLPTNLLRMVYAEITYANVLQEWRQSFPFSCESVVTNSDTSLIWYSYPEVTTVDSKLHPVFGIVDSHHILTNLRAKCCSTGISKCNIKRKAWLRVAETSKDNGSGLSLAHVKDLIDRQSNAYARKTFCKEVENCMRNNGDTNEADFCKLLREWYAADDEPGISSVERMKSRLLLRKWLLAQYDGFAFPPPGMYVKDIPIVTFEALLTNIERKIQLYAYIPSESYNPRAVSTLDAENFFSLFDDLYPSGGTRLKPESVRKCIQTACQLMSIRLDANRSFHMSTSRAPVYQQHGVTLNSSGETEMEVDVGSNTSTLPDGNSDMSFITVRDHSFDVERSHRKRKRKSGEVSKPNSYSRGARGVREYHRTDESKILPHVRLGIDLD